VLVLVSVGGIPSAAEAARRLSAGATLVQAYTGFVYGGPLWPSRVTRELAQLIRAPSEVTR
jgi:dihydroorotate dehydrogenase